MSGKLNQTNPKWVTPLGAVARDGRTKPGFCPFVTQTDTIPDEMGRCAGDSLEVMAWWRRGLRQVYEWRSSSCWAHAPSGLAALQGS